VPYRLLAFDYDETLAMNGRMHPAAAEALDEARRAGWRLALVTGRTHDRIVEICPHLGLFDLVVPENGCLLHTPASGAVEALAAGPVERLRAALTAAAIPYFPGRVVTITKRQYERQVRGVLEGDGLAFDCYPNRPAVMIVPRGTSKATGLAVGLARLGVAPEEVIALGDDENDLAMFQAVGLCVAVGNAVEAVRAAAHVVLPVPNGEGVAAFVRDRVLAAPRTLPDARIPEPRT
jgi:hydroxymethylpyrimidine pyrophosphatase-like HAD family hydrolase